MSNEPKPLEIESLIKCQVPFKHDGIYYHRLYLHDGSAVTNSSPISAQIAEWNAMIRLEMLVENGRI